MTIETEIEDLIQQEIKVLRNLLSNLINEQKALLSKNTDALNDTIDKRIDYLEHFEVLAQRLSKYTRQLAIEYHKQLPDEVELSHTQALELLKEMIPVDNVELRTLFGQLEALFAEIENQNNVTKYFLQTNRSDVPDYATNGAGLVKERHETKRKKVQLDVLDPNDKDILARE